MKIKTLSLVSTFALTFALYTGIGEISPSFVGQAANVCAAEGSTTEAVKLCGCTIRNRLLANWSISKVLGAYYASAQNATADQRKAVQAGLQGEGCNADSYYLMEEQEANKFFLASCRVQRAQVGKTALVTYPRQAWAQGSNCRVQ